MSDTFNFNGGTFTLSDSKGVILALPAENVTIEPEEVIKTEREPVTIPDVEMHFSMALTCFSFDGVDGGWSPVPARFDVEVEQPVQHRFPKSKRKRIRKKWAKDPRNWRPFTVTMRNVRIDARMEGEE